MCLKSLSLHSSLVGDSATTCGLLCLSISSHYWVLLIPVFPACVPTESRASLFGYLAERNICWSFQPVRNVLMILLVESLKNPCSNGRVRQTSVCCITLTNMSLWRLSPTFQHNPIYSRFSSEAELSWLEEHQRHHLHLLDLLHCWTMLDWKLNFHQWDSSTLSCIRRVLLGWMISPVEITQVAEPQALMWVIFYVFIMFTIDKACCTVDQRLGSRWEQSMVCRSINWHFSEVTGLGTPNFGKLKDLVVSVWEA